MNTRTLMRAAVVLAVVLAFTGPAAAVPVKVDLPKEGWSIAFDSPSLSKQEESRGDGEYAFRASSGRFNISLFVEKPGGAGKTHRDCYEFYWSLAKRNPMIAPDSVQSADTPKYVRVQYDIVTQFQGQPIGSGMSTTTSSIVRSGSTCTSRSSSPRRKTRKSSRRSTAACATGPDLAASFRYFPPRSRPNPLIDSRTPDRSSARQSEAWFDEITGLPRSRSSTSSTPTVGRPVPLRSTASAPGASPWRASW